MNNWNELPANLAVPVDDGAADHLAGAELPDLRLPSTSDHEIALRELKGLTVLYFYPKTGRPGVPLPEDWDQIPGARGCTPQSCSFRDHHAELKKLGADVFGVSTQDSAYQREARERLHLPFPLLSDHRLKLCDALRLPSMVAGGETLYRRLTLICRDTRIVRVFYPVYPPDRNAADVLSWLRENTARSV